MIDPRYTWVCCNCSRHTASAYYPLFCLSCGLFGVEFRRLEKL